MWFSTLPATWSDRKFKLGVTQGFAEGAPLNQSIQLCPTGPHDLDANAQEDEGHHTDHHQRTNPAQSSEYSD
jgi:hypothetical protein